MTSPLDRSIPPVVFALIARFGTAATLLTHEAVNYLEGSRGVDGSETSTAVVVTPPVPLREEFNGADSATTSSVETWLAASGLAVTPRPGDHVSFIAQGKNMTIEVVEAYYSGDALAAYRLIGGL